MPSVSELIRLKGHHVQGIRKSTSVAEAARVFLEKEVSSLLVYEDEKVVGIFTKNDLLRRCLASPDGFGDVPVGETMTTDLFTASSDADLGDVFEEMVRRGVRHVPVFEGDEAIGMITPIDILVHQNNAISFENQELMRYINGSY